MRITSRCVRQLILSQAPTVLVLGALAGIGYWGAAHDWAVPKFSALFSKPAEADEGPAVTVIPDSASEKSPDPAVRQFQNVRLRFPSAEAAQRAGLRWAPVETRSMAEYVTANGAIDYHHNYIAHLTVPVQGIVWRVEKQHWGEPVKKGEVLALVESADVGKAKAQFQEYLVTVNMQKRIYNNLKSNVSAETTITKARSDLRAAQIHLINAQQTLINLGLPVRIADFPDTETLDETQIRAQVTQKIRTLGIPPEIVKTLDFNEMSSNLVPLRAPFDGVVVGNDMVKGEVVNSMFPNRPQFTVADVRRMEILLDVRQEDIDKVHVGQEFVFHAAPAVAVRGTLEWVSTEADEKTRTIRVKAHVANDDGKLRAHVFGTGRIAVRAVPQAVVVPDEAVQADDNCRVVFVRLSYTEFQARVIKPGIKGDGYTQVLDGGVAPGEEVVTTGSHALKSEILRGRIEAEE